MIWDEEDKQTTPVAREPEGSDVEQPGLPTGGPPRQTTQDTGGRGCDSKTVAACACCLLVILLPIFICLATCPPGDD